MQAHYVAASDMLPHTSHHEDRRITFNTWRSLEHIWMDGIIDRLTCISRPFTKAIYVESAHFPPANLNQLEQYFPLTRHTLSQYEHLDLPQASCDALIFSPFLQWTHDVPGMLIQARRALMQNGFFIGCFFGQDTLRELKETYARIDIETHNGLSQRFLPMIHTHDAGMLMQRAGFHAPTADIDRYRLSIPSVAMLMHYLRNSHLNTMTPSPCAENHDRTQRPALPRHVTTHAESIYTRDFPHPDGGLCASIDIIFTSGWGAL